MKHVKRILKWTGIVLLVLVVGLGITYLCLPKGPRETVDFDDPFRTQRTQV